jgi:hypothetical protein
MNHDAGEVKKQRAVERVDKTAEVRYYLGW